MAWFAAPLIVKGLTWSAGVAASVLAGKKTKDWVSEKLEQKTRDKMMTELNSQATAYLTELEQAWYRAFWYYFAIQNGLLLVALGLSVWLGPWVFYLGLGMVFVWNGVLAYSYKSALQQLWQHKSLQALIAARLFESLSQHLKSLSQIEQRWVDWFVAEKQTEICQHAATHLYPRVRFALINVVLMLVLTLVVFRLAVIPFI
ncbi:hypothetical protein [Thiomicrospira cyclica]|uniref:Uncharacterized protein n=1 Tax=Thiomicrospira cyclica (strain DSM 14477 / JCM 11371 / ALM1) TaxID=717773 RepID=F6DCN9_THICA|nr:hypothetical protein [Thiomicrospira cyclica]AEG31625.1 hypothetical protein Thicy_0853 [Thiomicrospira cyclica ALM1]